MVTVGPAVPKDASQSLSSSAGVLLLIVAASFALGVSTAYAQGWLPDEVGSLANSSGSWALVGFLLAMLTTSPATAAVAGSLSLLSLLTGYIVGAVVLDYPMSTSLLVFWGAAATLVGPPLGLGGYWVKHRDVPLAGAGAGAMSGVLIGEGVYGLTFIADSTYPPYWWASISAGMALLLIVLGQRHLGSRTGLLAVAASALTAGAFVAVYSQASTLLSVLS